MRRPCAAVNTRRGFHVTLFLHRGLGGKRLPSPETGALSAPFHPLAQPLARAAAETSQRRLNAAAKALFHHAAEDSKERPQRTYHREEPAAAHSRR